MFEGDSLRGVSIFAELPPTQLRLIADQVQVRTYSAGSVIFREGDTGDAVYFVASGRVKISATAVDGKEKIIHLMQRGQVFGEVVLLEGGAYPATATAMDDSDIGILRNQQLFQLVSDHSELAISMLKLLSRRLRMAQAQVRDLALKDAFTRVGELVLSLAEQSGRSLPDGAHLSLTMTREELANMAGTTRETFTRMLGEFRQLGLIRPVRGGLIIPDIHRLRSHLSSE